MAAETAPNIVADDVANIVADRLGADLTQRQHERRESILNAAMTLASRGGYDAVQMRDVADSAEVALGTLYRYFPGKVQLLVSLLARQTLWLSNQVRERPPSGDMPADRVSEILRRGTKALQRDRNLTEAMVRALMFADEDAGDEVDAVSAVANDFIIRAMHGRDVHAPTEDDLAKARVLEHVWWSAIVAWLSGRTSAKQMTDDIETATRLVLS